MPGRVIPAEILGIHKAFPGTHGVRSEIPEPSRVTQRPLRTHQARVAAIVQAVAAGEAVEVRDILAAVTPGGGKSLLPVIAAAALVRAGIVDRICWVVPRDSLRLQAEEAFADPAWRTALSHGLSVRAAGNDGDPCRGLAGYVTTYQGIAAAPDLHLAEFARHKYLLVVDEVHHLPALSDAAPDPLAEPGADEASGWSRALQPLLETARLRLLLSGTLERADGRGILWLPYRAGPRSQTREVEPGRAGLGRGGLQPRPGPCRTGRAAGHVRRAGWGGELAGPGREAARRHPHPGRPAPPVQPLADRADPARPVHGAPHWFCGTIAERSLHRHTRPARPPPGRAGRGRARRADPKRPGQAAGRGLGPGRGPALSGGDPRLVAARPSRTPCAWPPATSAMRGRRWPATA